VVVSVAIGLVCDDCLGWHPHFRSAHHDCQHSLILFHAVNWIDQWIHLLQKQRQTSSPHQIDQETVGYSLQV
jgi:hypothetical protein